MDREFIVEFANKFHKEGRVLENDVNYLITSYCDEFKKDSHKTVILIALLKQLGTLNKCITIALDYFMIKYNVFTLYRNIVSENAFGTMTTKEILLIY